MPIFYMTSMPYPAASSLPPAVAELVLVDLMRAISRAIVLAAACFMPACSMPVSVTRPGDLYTFGRLEDISSSDFRALLTAAQERRKRIAPHSTIHDIRIVSCTEAKVIVYTSGG